MEMKTSGYLHLVLLLTLCFCCAEVLAAKNKEFTDSITGMQFVYLPGGCFQMGQTVKESYKYSNKNELPRHEVCVDGFYMGKYEVTLGEFKKLIDINNRSFIEKGSYRSPSFGKMPGWPHMRDLEYFQKGDRYPAQDVSWDDAQDFIKELNRRSGKKYRLPTEAEWEYAARGGTTTSRHWGDGISCEYAMYDNLDFRTRMGPPTHGCIPIYVQRGWTYNIPAPVGSFAANQYGLYDMLGNVEEWCGDRYQENYYSTSPRNNPTGPSSGDSRVVRGGGWRSSATGIRSATRYGVEPHAHDNRGFRLVLK